MYRVMIVDDEPLILAGIASMIDWEEQGLVIDSKAGSRRWSRSKNGSRIL